MAAAILLQLVLQAGLQLWISALKLPKEKERKKRLHVELLEQEANHHSLINKGEFGC